MVKSMSAEDGEFFGRALNHNNHDRGREWWRHLETSTIMRRYRETKMTDEEQARLIMQEDPLILDTETIGLGRDAEICEIAVIDARGRILIDTNS